MKNKKHKPFNKQQIGKRVVFYRDAKQSEMPPLNPNLIHFNSSGCSNLNPIIKDNGKLIRIEKTTTSELKRKYTDDETYVEKICQSIYYEYSILTKNGTYRTDSYKMDSGINGFNVIKAYVQPLNLLDKIKGIFKKKSPKKK